MAKRLSFIEFNDLLSRRLIRSDQLAEYIQLDENAAIPHLIFRTDALTDNPPAAYDLDEEVYRYQRELRRREADLLDTLSVSARIRVVAEGDSWFNLPWGVRPPAIADQLGKDRRFRVDNIAKWGHTIQDIIHSEKYLDEVDEQTQWYMFSAGGNDLQACLADGTGIHPYDKDRPIDAYLTGNGRQVIQDIHDGYTRILTNVNSSFPRVRVLTHGYDYPRPLVGRGQYIGRYLRRKSIADIQMQPVVNPIIDLLNEKIMAATNQFSFATFLNCRRITDPYTWYDDMHPEEDGFGALADVFAEAMN